MATKKVEPKAKAKAKTKTKAAGSKKKTAPSTRMSIKMLAALDIARWLGKHGRGGPTTAHLAPYDVVSKYDTNKTNYYRLNVAVVSSLDPVTKELQHRLTIEPFDDPYDPDALEHIYPLPFKAYGYRLIVSFNLTTPGWEFMPYSKDDKVGPIAIIHYRKNGQASGKDDYVHEITDQGVLRVVMIKRNIKGYHLYNLWAREADGLGSAELDPIIENGGF